MTNFKNKNIVILGWGVDTQDVVPYLQSLGAKITVMDSRSELDTKNTHNLNFLTGMDNFGDLSTFNLIIRNPAVYRYRPEIVAAEKKGVEVSSKIKIFFELCPGKIIGVTGTKGKGTTSTLIYEILKSAGADAYLGGNIGKGVFDYLPLLTSESWMILELSSFQLIDLHKSPHIAVVLMTTVEHQNWHISPQDYIDAKKPIVKFQSKNDFAVVNKDYPNSVEIGKEGLGEKRWISGRELDISSHLIKLRGFHNLENVAAAVEVAKIVGVTKDIVEKTISEFKGLEHRLEEVATVNDVTYFNDSFSTTPETTIAAINSFTEPMILIIGGSDKGSDFHQLGRIIVQKKNVKAVILIGLMTERIAGAIEEAGNRKDLIIVKGLVSMPEIVSEAEKLAKPGDVVVLSPAAASFDMFDNYKDRGQQFKKQVLSLH